MPGQGDDPDRWQKSSWSGSANECVEVSFRELVVRVRDSKDPRGPVLTFSRLEWGAFVRGVREGEFDD